MKLNGLGGVGTGKLGNQVFSVRAGQQIVRQYNPIVANPQTAAQVETRSKLKLMSQLAAVVAPVIAIPADGLKSKRNLFISKNYGSAYYDEETASIEMEDVELTKGTAYLPAVKVYRNNSLNLQVYLSEDADAFLDRVVYCAVIRNSDGSMRLLGSATVQISTTNKNGLATLPYTSAAVTVYAYGIRYNNDDARAYYGALGLDSAGAVASIVSSRDANTDNVTITETKAKNLATGAGGDQPGGNGGGGDNPGEGD